MGLFDKLKNVFIEEEEVESEPEEKPNKQKESKKSNFKKYKLINKTKEKTKDDD